MWIVYNGEKYFIQGYTKNKIFHLEINKVFKEEEFWEKFIDKDHQKCVDNFISAKMFGGKTFWEIENEIEWVD